MNVMSTDFRYLTEADVARPNIKHLPYKPVVDCSMPSAIAYLRGLAKAKRLVCGFVPIEYRKGETA